MYTYSDTYIDTHTYIEGFIFNGVIFRIGNHKNCLPFFGDHLQQVMVKVNLNTFPLNHLPQALGILLDTKYHGKGRVV